MNRWMYRFPIPILTVFMLLLGTVSPVFAQEPTADLSLTKTADRKNVKIGQSITFTITVTNLGPDTATDVYFGDSLPDPLNFVCF